MKPRGLTVMSAVGWAWAVMIIASRDHLLNSYAVIPSVEPGWGVLVTPAIPALFAVVGAIAMALAMLKSRPANRQWAERWLMLAWIIPAADLCRMAVPEVPITLLEPLALAFVTGQAIGRIGWGEAGGVSHRGATCLVAAAAMLLAVWWFLQADQAYRDYMLGFNDFGQFAQRIDSTWTGQGWLMECPGLPPFWDHFNPGLLLLVPAWGIWPDVRLLFALQAVCLAIPALLVYGIARHFRYSATAAAAWSLAYLCYPAIGQMNLNYTYGWHPVSCALPLLFAAIWALLSGRVGWAAILAVGAASFKEDVIVVLGLFAGAMAIWNWQAGRRADRSPPIGTLSATAWTGVALAFLVVFALVYWLAGFRLYQTSRFGNLGGSSLEILLSPLLRPAVFWTEVFKPRSFFYLAALLLPLGVHSLARGRWILATVAVPVGVLLAWNHAPATSIAFQYATALIPFLFLAVIYGSAPERVAPRLPHHGALAAFASSATLAVALGALPYSGATLTDVEVQTYPVIDERHVRDLRRSGTDAAIMLDGIVARVRSPDAAVLATGRVAAHLLGVRRLETVGQAVRRRPYLCDEQGREIGVRVFDWIVIDSLEFFQQTADESREILDEARDNGYEIVESAHGIIVLKRPDSSAR